MKILLVDDDSFLLDMYANKFTASKHAVDSTKSVEGALEKLRGGNTYDAVLLDMVLPNMTGVDLLKVVQNEKLGGAAKFIVLSNQSDDHDRKAALEAGAAGYIIKAEMIPSEVVTAVEGIIGGSHT